MSNKSTYHYSCQLYNNHSNWRAFAWERGCLCDYIGHLEPFTRFEERNTFLAEQLIQLIDNFNAHSCRRIKQSNLTDSTLNVLLPPTAYSSRTRGSSRTRDNANVQMLQMSKLNDFFCTMRPVLGTYDRQSVSVPNVQNFFQRTDSFIGKENSGLFQ